jgi:hypothetical protein
MVQRCKIETPNTQIHARLLQGLQYKVVVLMKLFYYLISMSTPRHKNESDVTKIKAAYPGYM